MKAGEEKHQRTGVEGGGREAPEREDTPSPDLRADRWLQSGLSQSEDLPRAVLLPEWWHLQVSGLG